MIMRLWKRKRDNAALNSILIRRPIQRYFWLFLLPTFAAFCVGFLYITGTGCECCLFHAVGKVCHGAFSFQKSSVWLTCGVLPDLF